MFYLTGVLFGQRFYWRFGEFGYSARTWPFMEVRGIYLMSKAARIVFHKVILPV